MRRSGAENKAILKQFRDWLTQTIEEIGGEDFPGADEAAEEKADDARLDPFTAFVFSPSVWAEEVTRLDDTIRLDGSENADEPEMPENRPPSAAAAPPAEIGLRQLVEAFTSMRHDLKLQTKSARGLESLLQSALAGLETAMDRFQTVQASGPEAGERAARPFVETLVGLDEAFLRGARAFELIRERMAQTGREPSRASMDEPSQRLPGWRRWFVRDEHRRDEHRQMGRPSAETLEQCNTEDFAHLMEGYALIHARIERALREHEIIRIDSVGRRVDPAEMTVVELVDSPDVEPEMVAEEVRPGYKWRDKVIRFAEVRAVRGRVFV